MPHLLTITNQASIRTYFETISQLAKEGREFPIDLEEVWPLAYKRKEEAIRALKRRNFIAGIDYQFFRQDAEKSGRGRPVEGYMLSLSCFEFFIARKVRPVFEMYRQFFHRVISTTQPFLPTDGFLQQQEQRLTNLEQQLKLMLEFQQQAARSLLELPRSSEPLPIETTRIKIQRLVNGYCRAKGVGQQEVWRTVYDRLYYLYRVSIRSYKRSDRESWLDVAERNDHLEKIYAIVSAELTYLDA